MEIINTTCSLSFSLVKDSAFYDIHCECMCGWIKEPDFVCRYQKKVLQETSKELQVMQRIFDEGFIA